MKPCTYVELVIGMMQAKHNMENPEHKCNCLSFEEMILKSENNYAINALLKEHFEKHKK